MLIAPGKVVNGRVVDDAALPEGADVTLIVTDGEEPFEVGADLAAIILDATAEGQRGNVIPAGELLRDLRSRE